MEAVVAAGVHGAPCVAEAAIGIGVDLMSLRHHLLSIAGIFLGLGLGILIGASVTSDQILLARQQAMIDRLTRTSPPCRRRARRPGQGARRLQARRGEPGARGGLPSLAGQRVALAAMGTVARWPR